MAKRRVLAAMSGGVDSTVAVAVLQQHGYEVIGLTLLADASQDDERAAALRRPALEAAAQMGVYHRFVMCNDIPDVRCGCHVWWPILMEQMHVHGVDYVATGHYARIMEVNNQPTLWRGLDPAKDQSALLFDLSPACLERTLLPMGPMNPNEVRDCATGLGLRVSEPVRAECATDAPGEVRMACREFIVARLRWQGSVDGRSRHVCDVQIDRDRAPVLGSVSPLDDGRVRVTLSGRRFVVGPGQAVVFFGGERVLGGGWIESVTGTGGT